MAARSQAAAGGTAAAAAGRHHELAALKQHFPGREQAIDQLAAELCRSGSLGTNLLVYGPPATGKTAVVRALLRTLQVRHAYVNCNEAARARPLLASVLHQLKGGKRQRDECYDAGVKCDGIADFRLQLPGVVGRRRGPCWLVLDSSHRLAGSDLLTALLRAREDTGAEVAVLLVGAAGWASGRYLRDTAAAPPPRELHFAAYRPDQLQRIMEHRRQRLEYDAGDASPYRQFLTAFVPSFCRASNNLLDLQAAVAQLFPRYMQPLREGHQLQSLQLYRRIKEDVQQCIQTLALQQARAPLAAAAAWGADAGVAHSAKMDRMVSPSGLGYELPYVSKFLLLAAFVASRNKPTADRAVFDPSYRKKGRNHAQAHDRQVEAAVEAKLRGPHAFPLERLLHIFYVIYAHHDVEDEEEEQGEEAQRVMQQAEVLQQVSSLVALRLLEQCSGDALEGQLYRCNLGEAQAEALGANVKLRLGDYLKMA